jgi:GTP-binding protein
MVIKNVNLETVCGITSTFPDNPHYEVAFAGKSNVGKSSLINALMNRKALARTSSQPGKTQTINFYNVNDAMYLVDLPGYGYANANVEIKAKWGKMIEKYLHTSSKLKAVFLLIDIRHEPSDNDCLMYEWMVEQGFAPIIIATKMDKISKGALQKHMKLIADTLHVEPDTIMIPFSAETKQGREEIWELIDSLVMPEGEVADGQPGAGESAQASVADQLPAEKAGGVAKKSQGSRETETVEKPRKERWKAAGKEVAKKTKKQQERKAAKHAVPGKKTKKK